MSRRSEFRNDKGIGRHFMTRRKARGNRLQQPVSQQRVPGKNVPPAPTSRRRYWFAALAVGLLLVPVAYYWVSRISAKERFKQGDAYLEKREHAQAIAQFNEAIRLDPKFANAYVMRGNCYSESGEQQKALADFSEAIRLDPKPAHAYISRGA